MNQELKLMKLTTKLLVSDGDIVVIGGIKINTKPKQIAKLPGLSKVPVVGNLFKNTRKI